ncbi:recombinase family protein [Lysobacter enzymogenes]|uniref:recombinase family protein n=1 Tax=Lysobacter enzymogenes TaxID=69 RepID=UPI001AF91297|nr:recombinase family protein [Lysobacter enzymogenes]QQQ01006.1 recombinase family protein [Lysobacter enzymogenes]
MKLTPFCPVAIYARSGEPDPKSIAEQCAEAIQYARTVLGATATVAYSDDGYTGRTLARPALQTLLHHVWCGHVRTIVVTSPCRLTQVHLDHLRLQSRFEQANAKVVVAKTPFRFPAHLATEPAA